jgi:hypothetical protein
MKKFAVILIIVLSIFQINAQESTEVDHPSAPDFSGNQKGLLNLSTGAISQTIPIVDIVQNDLSIPVYLSFNSSGIKVTDIPGIVGLGWNLTVGGTIQVEQRGRYDLDQGYPESGGGFSISGELVSLIPSNTDQMDTKLEFILNSVHPDYGLNGSSDTEPDIFHYNLPGMAGQFVFNNNGQIISLTDPGIKIEYNSATSSDPIDDEILITDTKGIKYHFICLSYSYFESTGYSSPTFFLYKIENLNTGNFIEIIYDRNKPFGKEHKMSGIRKFVTECSEINYNYEDFLNGGQHVSEVFGIGIYPVQSIETNTSKVSFSYYEGSSEYISGKLKDITISSNLINKLKDYKQFRFEYSNDFLKKLIVSYNENYLEDDDLNLWVVKDGIYQFNYSGGAALTLHDIDEYDYWGYYNNKTGDFNDPSTFSPNASLIHNLRQIIFPQGNEINWEFELNTFEDNHDGWTGGNSGAGLRVKKIIQIDEFDKQIVTEYDYEGGKLSSFPLLKNKFTYIVENTTDPDVCDLYSHSSRAFTLNGSFVTYSKVTQYSGGKQAGTNKGVNGKIIYTFRNEYSHQLMPEDYPNLTEFFTGTPGNEERYNTSFYQTGRERCFQFNFPYKLLVNDQMNGLLKETVVKDSLDRIISSTEYNYDVTAKTASTGLKLYDYYWWIVTEPPLGGYPETKTTQYYGLGLYSIMQYKTKLAETRKKIYKKGDINNFNETVYTYEYAEDSNSDLIIESPVKKTVMLSSGEKLETYYYYPFNYTGQSEIVNTMMNRNMQSIVIKTEKFKNNKKLSGTNTIFDFKNTGERNIIVPSQSQILENGMYKTHTWYDGYDNKGRLLESHGIDGIHSGIIYGFNNTLPVASFTNAFWQNIFYTSFEDIEDSNIIKGDAYSGEKSFNGSFTFDAPEYFGPKTLSYRKKKVINGYS